MKKILVLGIGSIVGEDQLGWKVINRLERLLEQHPESYTHVELLTVARADPLLLNIMSHYDHCILVDAFLIEASGDRENGCIVRELGLNEIETADGKLSSHGFGLGQTLQLGQNIGMLPDSVEIIGISTTKNGLKTPDECDSVEIAASRIVQKILKLHKT